MIKVDHLAIWVNNLELMRGFYETYFAVVASERYHNSTKNFSSYFLSFGKGCRIELMHKPDIQSPNTEEKTGLAHLALSLGSRARVDTLTSTLRKDGFIIAGEPRVTGDGYYESVILDPEGNRIELTE